METSSAPQAPSSPAPEAAIAPDSQKPKRRWFFKRYGFWLGVAFLSSTNILAWGGWTSLEAMVDELPETKVIRSFSRDGTSTIRAADNSILQQQGPATRQKVSKEEMPEKLMQAFLAAEDRRFYEHNGVDNQGILRAAGVNLREGDVVEGGSTVTQQLARMVFLNQEKSAIRKLREAMLALKIEDEMSKDDILNYYLNLVYLGSGAYGVADAAWVYFQKGVTQLTLPEMATLAGLPPAPTDYSPIQNPDIAKRRRNLVLDVMAEEDMITAREAEEAKAQELAINPQPPRRLEVRAPYFTSYVLQELPKYVSKDDIEFGGLVVETTLLPKWQDAALAAAEKSVKQRGKWQRFEQVAIVSVDPRNGEIRTMVGGLDFIDNQYNRVTQARRQPGSTFKGVVYAAGISAGLSPYAQYLDAPYKVDGYKPKNFSGKFSGWQSVVKALTQSTNIVALKVMLDTGIEPTIEMARKMGIESKLEPTYALSLGAYEVT
ncbi:MAG: transglycosylase domain-containing protein, partial [Cyanobacteria bacterium P01_D01_bin.73]